jgi:flagellar protein FliO/FliZ
MAALFAINVEQATADKALPGNSQGAVQEQTADSESGVLPDGDVVKAIIKMISALIIVILVVYLGLYLLRRLMGRRYGQATGSDVLEVLQTAYIGPHKAVSLVKVANRSVLIGVTDHQVSVLTELDAAETQEILAATEVGERESFASTLRRSVEKVREIGLRKKRPVLET